MTGWDIDPAGVSGVVKKVGGHVTGDDGLKKQVENFGTHVENAAKASASGIIGKALAEFVKHYSGTLKGMGTGTSSAVTGAVDATKFYIQGDLDMAAEAQKKATRT